ncbi:hypothetical protein BH11BAC2_BH11BAC2_16490 [soil metagenome]
MDIFSQKKLLIRLVILLIVLNVASIGVVVWKDFRHRPGHGMFPPPPPAHFSDVSGILQKELNLNAEQVVQLNHLRNAYFEKEREVLSTLHSQRDSMNMIMFNKNTDEQLVLDLAKRVSENEYKMELLRWNQAKELKALCTPEQLEKFEEYIVEIRDYFRPDNQPPGRPH